MNEYAKISNIGRPHMRLPDFNNNMDNISMARIPEFGFGNQGGIQGALQPLRSYISQQLQQKTNEEIGPFIEEVAGNAQETFDIQSGGGYNGGLMPFSGYGGMERIPTGGGLQSLFNPMSRGNEDFLFHQNKNRAVPMANGGYVYSGGFERGRGDSNVPIMDENMLDFQKQQEEQQRQNDADDRAAKFTEQTLQGKLNAPNVPGHDATGTQKQIDPRRAARRKTGIQSLMMNTPDPETGVTPNQRKNFLTNQTSRFYDNPIDRPKSGFFSNLIKGSMP